MDINVFAIIVAAIAGMALGALWHSPALFGNLWMQLSGITKADVERFKRDPKAKAQMTRGYVLGFIGQFVTAGAIAIVMAWTGLSGLADGIILAGVVWLGLIVTSSIDSVLWENRSWNLWVLGVTYRLLQLLIMGAIIGAWP